LPVVLIEAMAAGLAVVITPVGNVRDAVEDGISALLIAPRDSSGLRDALGRLLADSELRRALGKAAYRVAAREYGAETAVNRFIDAAERAAGHRGSLRERSRAQAD
jgi:glycosyltransferase involved in cell wall biosynthesis